MPPDRLPAALHQLAEVEAQRLVGKDVHALKLAVPKFPPTLPGQFVMLRVTEGGDPLLGRAMALYRIERVRGRVLLTIVYRVVGRGTALLSLAAPGRKLWVLGPLGRTFHLPPPGARPLLVGGGTGIASLHLLAEMMAAAQRAASRARPPDLTVLIGARTRREVLCRADFAALGARVRIATDDGSQGARGRVTQLLDQELAGEERRGRAYGLVYACGPAPMMEAAFRICERDGIACQVSLEGPMACGFGVCLGCAVPCRPEVPRGAGADKVLRDDPASSARLVPDEASNSARAPVARETSGIRSPRDRFKLVCTDGPVFDAYQIAWSPSGPGAPAARAVPGLSGGADDDEALAGEAG
jgi:dihydroorotate dehydrogenase electron transfer subunit